MTTFYRKHGRRYIPVAYGDPEFDRSFPAGAHLVVVQPGSESRIFNINPDAAPLLAALKLCEEDIMRVMVQASMARPDREPLTDKQMDAYNRFKAAMGDENLCLLRYPSLREIYDTLVEKLVKLSKDNHVTGQSDEDML